LIQVGVGLMFLQLEITAGEQAAFLYQQDLESGCAEYFRAGGTAGAAADDGDIRFQGQVLLQLCSAGHFPVALESFDEQIRKGHAGALLFRCAAGLDSRIAAMTPGCCSRTAESDWSERSGLVAARRR